MKRYLIDSTVVIDYLKGKDASAEMLTRVSQPLTSIIVQGEVLQGIKNKQEFKKVNLVFEKFHILPINQYIGSTTINLLKDYTLSHGMSLMDALIAATAIEKDLTLVTDNIKHFQFIEELEVIKPEQVR